jgi:beta-galactosidase
MRNVYDIYIEARQHRHGLYPEQPLLVSEYGDWEYFAQNAGFNQQDWKDLMEVERNSRQPRFAGEKRMLQQALNIQEAHNDNLSTHAFADGYWVMFDYNRGMAPVQEYSGIMDIFRLPKFSYYFLQSQRSYSPTNPFSVPVLFIASYWQPGVSKQVRIFSNAQEVELFVDGISAGRQKPDSNSLTTHLIHPPFTFNVACKNPGMLKAIAYIDGKMIAEQTVQTSESADHIALQIDESGKPAGQNDVVFVYARIEDRNNTLVETDSSAVTFTVDGAHLIGSSTINAPAGIATAVIRTQNKTSKITLKANSNNLKSDTKYLQIN